MDWRGVMIGLALAERAEVKDWIVYTLRRVFGNASQSSEVTQTDLAAKEAKSEQDRKDWETLLSVSKPLDEVHANLVKGMAKAVRNGARLA